ncbi:YfhO family protein [soil metagenome]
MNDNILKKLQPHLIALGIFLLITVVYFSPAFQGKTLGQHDIAQWIGMSKEITDYRTKTGIEPLWTNSMFGGMPAYQISVMYPANLIQYVNDALFLGLPSPANLLFICLLGFYILMITMRADYRLAIAGAIAYAFCSYFFVIIVAGHNTKAHAIALIPLVIAGVLMTYRGRAVFGAALTALALSLEIYANHLQITYYLAMAIGVLVLCEGIQAVMNKKLPDFLKASAFLGIAAALAVLPNITNLWSTYEYGEYSTRGASELSEKKVSTGLDKDYALSWSYGRLETMTLLIPDFKGGSSGYKLDEKSKTYQALVQNTGSEGQAKSFIRQAPVYWGDQPSTSGPVYNGAIIFFLFVLSIFLLRGYMQWWLIAVTLLSIMLAWGRHFLPLTDFFFDHVPGYNKFRAVSMMLVLASFTLPFAAMLAVMKFTDGSINKERLKKSLQYSLYITGGFCLIFILVPGMFCDFIGNSDKQLEQYDWLLTALRSDRESILRMDAMRSLFFIGVGFALLWFWLKDKLNLSMMLMGLCLFILIDMWGVDKRYLNNDNFTGTKSSADRPFTESAVDQQILQDKSYYRVYNTTVDAFSDASTSYFHKSIGGYHGAKLKRYQELIEFQIGKGNMSVLNMLNTKYFIVRNPQDQQQSVAQQNPVALGNAWFVNDWKIVPNADAEMKALDSLNTKQDVVIDKRFESVVQGLTPGIDTTGTISLTSYAPNELKYASSTSKDQFAVFSEIYYPKGWNAYIDGKLTPYAQVNYVLRGMKIPSGKHTIDFKFEPEVYSKGEKISLFGSVAVLLLFVGAGYMEVKSSDKSKTAIKKG